MLNNFKFEEQRVLSYCRSQQSSEFNIELECTTHNTGQCRAPVECFGKVRPLRDKSCHMTLLHGRSNCDYSQRGQHFHREARPLTREYGPLTARPLSKQPGLLQRVRPISSRSQGNFIGPLSQIILASTGFLGGF